MLCRYFASEYVYKPHVWLGFTQTQELGFPELETHNCRMDGGGQSQVFWKSNQYF